MTLLEPLISMWPWNSPPHTPTSVLFEPTLIDPVIEPLIQTTAALVPLMAAFRSASVVTVLGAALPPPVVPPDWAAQPTSALGSGGDAQPLAPPEPGLPL